MKKKPIRYYVVTVGARPGVYDTWKKAKKYVECYPGSCYKSYPTKAQAIAAFNRCRHFDYDASKNFQWQPPTPPRNL